MSRRWNQLQGLEWARRPGADQSPGSGDEEVRRQKAPHTERIKRSFPAKKGSLQEAAFSMQRGDKNALHRKGKGIRVIS